MAKSKQSTVDSKQSPDLEMSDAPYDLPDGWRWATVAEVGSQTEQTVLTGPFGANLGREDFIESGVPVLTIGCLTDSGITLDKAKYISKKKAQELATYTLKTGDLLFSRMASVGRADIVPSALNGTIFNYHLMRLRLSEKVINSKFFIYTVRGSQAVADYIKEVNHGVTRDGINTKQLLGLPIALPPLSEQQHIVARIESLFAESRTARDALERVPALLKRFRQSVLASAFRGELTQDADGELPDDWKWVKVSDIAEVVRGQMPRPAGNPKYYGNGTIPWITVGEITKDNGMYLTSTSKLINEEGKKKSRYVKPGTLLLTNSGATLGVPKITKIGGCIHDGNLALQKIDGDAKMYLYYFLASQTQNLRNINQGAAQPNLNIKMVSEIDVPLAPLAEQRRIVAKIESLFAQADAIERAVAIAQQRADKLDQAILARAFRGEV